MNDFGVLTFNIPIGIRRKLAVQDSFGVVSIGFPRAPHASGYQPSSIHPTPAIVPVNEKAPTIFATASSLNWKVVPWFALDISPWGGNKFTHGEPIQFVRSNCVKKEFLLTGCTCVQDHFCLNKWMNEIEWGKYTSAWREWANEWNWMNRWMEELIEWTGEWMTFFQFRIEKKKEHF